MVAFNDSFSTVTSSDDDDKIVISSVGSVGWGIGPLCVLDYFFWIDRGFLSSLPIVEL